LDISQSVWSEIDASNNAAVPNGWPEGQQPSSVNNCARADRGALKRWYNWTNPKTTAGSSTNYTLTYDVASGALVDGMSHLVQFNAANANAPTLSVNGLAATPLQYYSAGAWRAVPAGLWDADEIFRVAYNSSAGAYRLMDFRNRTGEVVPYAGATAPAGTLLCYGQAISRTAYVGLFTALGTTHGAGDTTTTFNLPDLRGRVAAGKDNMGGSAASRLSVVMTGTTLGATGGSERTAAMDGPSVGITVEGSAPVQPTSVGSSAHVHNNTQIVQPTIILNYIIRI
jgi:microcystin-dependent protein